VAVREICIYGRGGQGSLVLAQFMAIAALEDGKYGQAFPFLGGGGERRGKPIMAFCRLSDRPIRIRSRVSQADYLIVQDATIFKDEPVLDKIKPGGIVLVNTPRTHCTSRETGPRNPWPAHNEYSPSGGIRSCDKGAQSGGHVESCTKEVSRRNRGKKCEGGREELQGSTRRG